MLNTRGPHRIRGLSNNDQPEDENITVQTSQHSAMQHTDVLLIGEGHRGVEVIGAAMASYDCHRLTHVACSSFRLLLCYVLRL